MLVNADGSGSFDIFYIQKRTKRSIWKLRNNFCYGSSGFTKISIEQGWFWTCIWTCCHLLLGNKGRTCDRGLHIYRHKQMWNYQIQGHESSLSVSKIRNSNQNIDYSQILKLFNSKRIMGKSICVFSIYEANI